MNQNSEGQRGGRPRVEDVVLDALGWGAKGNSELQQAEKQLDTLVRAKMSEGLEYHQALKLVASENPELNRKYTRLVRQRGTHDSEY